jgi:branched-chain amino acid transport system permease protein
MLATSSFPVTIATGLIFMICVLVFRRGVVGEVYAWLERRKTVGAADGER